LIDLLKKEKKLSLVVIFDSLLSPCLLYFSLHTATVSVAAVTAVSAIAPAIVTATVIALVIATVIATVIALVIVTVFAVGSSL
jgi:hypothetical protein